MSFPKSNPPTLRRAMLFQVVLLQAIGHILACLTPYFTCCLYLRVGPDTLESIKTMTYLALAISLTTDLASWFWFEYKVTRPIIHLTEAMRQWHETGVPAVIRIRCHFRELAVLKDLLGWLFTKTDTRIGELIDLIGAIDHDMRHPLQVTKVAVKILTGGRRRPSDAKIGKIATDIRAAADSIGNTLSTNRALAASYSHINGAPLTRVSIRRLIASSLGGLRPLAGAMRQTLEEVPSERPIIALAQRQKLESILHNLVTNAIKFTPSGGRIRVTSERTTLVLKGQSETVPAVSLVVDDSGPGIPPEDRERIFERGVRLEATADRPGSGFGLATVREHVRDYGGECDCSDSPLGGARFTVTLPILAYEPDPKLAALRRLFLRLTPSRKRWFAVIGFLPPIATLGFFIVYDFCSKTVGQWFLAGSILLCLPTTLAALLKVCHEALFNGRWLRATARLVSWLISVLLGSVIARVGLHWLTCQTVAS